MVNMLSFRKISMTEGAGIARLWQGFHHLSEHDKDLVLTIAEAVGYSEQGVQTAPEQVDGLCDGAERQNK